MTAFHIEAIWVAISFVGMATAISAVVAILVSLGYGVLRSVDRRLTAKPYWKTVRGALPFVFLLSMVGGLTGQLGGGSREGVVGELVPALMTLFGGFIAYFLGTKRDPGGKVSVNALAFLLGFFVMYNVAAVWRQDGENYGFCRDLFSNADIDQEAERYERYVYWYDYCSSVDKGLPLPTGLDKPPISGG